MEVVEQQFTTSSAEAQRRAVDPGLSPRLRRRMETQFRARWEQAAHPGPGARSGRGPPGRQ